ncbi:MAG: VOC family protein [Flavobacteriia bacterium]|nr:VOC family protein [Flavobacteriia bacterium]OJX36321.1 MAG: bleomycin resistance protein [Flavobacteriia bacterium 40-80]
MKIKELTLLTNNLTETKKFYEDTIGFQKITETQTSISFAVGTSKLVFELTEENQNPKYHFAFNIPTNALNDAINWTLQRTSLIETENSFITDFENWKAKAIYFFDNNRNILEFICRTDLNNPTDKPFSAETILNINEIGLVIDQPLQIGNEIIEKTRIEYFAKGPKREDFVAVGNDDGLFVISNPNRKWYPTQEMAEKWKVKGKIKVADNEYELEFN